MSGADTSNMTQSAAWISVWLDEWSGYLVERDINAELDSPWEFRHRPRVQTGERIPAWRPGIPPVELAPVEEKAGIAETLRKSARNMLLTAVAIVLLLIAASETRPRELATMVPGYQKYRDAITRDIEETPYRKW